MKRERLWYCLVALLLALLPTVAAADVGPKPSLEVLVTLDGQPLPDARFKARLLTCLEPGVTAPGRQEEFFPGNLDIAIKDPAGCVWKDAGFLVWGSDGESGVVRFTYMVPRWVRVAVYLPSKQKIYVTEPAEWTGILHGNLAADLRPDGAGTLRNRTMLEKSQLNLDSFALAVPITLVIELGIVLAYVLVRRIPAARPLLVGLVASIVTISGVWLLTIAGFLIGGPLVGLFLFTLAEFGAWGMESALYWRPGNLPFLHAVLLALVANLASFGVGVVMH